MHEGKTKTYNQIKGENTGKWVQGTEYSGVSHQSTQGSRESP